MFIITTKYDDNDDDTTGHLKATHKENFVFFQLICYTHTQIKKFNETR